MSRIGGVGSLTSGQLSSLNRIRQLGSAINENTKRISTLKRINSAKDDPAGLIRATLLQSNLTAAGAASTGITHANALLNTADAAATEIVSQLQSARTLALEAVGGALSEAEVAANQIEIDSILQSIDSQARTEFAGRRLLDGSSGFRTSGYDPAEILDVDVLSKRTGDSVAVDVNVTVQAAQAIDTYDNSVALAADATLIVEGSRGSAVVSLSTGASTQDITDAFNAVSELTGITAAVNGTDVDFTSVEYGSDAVINIDVTDGTFATDGGNSAQGTDAVATVNGTQVTGDGTTLTLSSSELSAVIELDPSANGVLTSFAVSGEGLEFVVGTSISTAARIGLPNFNSASLGGATGNLTSIGSGGTNSLNSGNLAQTLQVIDDAITDVTRSQAIVGSFQRYTLDSSANVLASQIEHMSAALSSIQDVDIALETALLSNNQLLQETAYEALSISSLQNRGVLSLLQSTVLQF